jgi:3-phenylpropionate/cinnamic acid dioxygenase small subunit
MPLVSERRARTAVPVEVQRDVERFLFDEADLLDDWEFREWLGLMAPDIHYWAPTRENRLYRERKKEMAGPGESAYFDERHAELTQRVDRLYTHMAWAEEPPSRTRHLITNIRVGATERADEFDVESSFYVYRTRGERDVDHVVGKRYDLIRRADNPYGFQIAKRTIVFDMATLLVKNLSLFY